MLTLHKTISNTQTAEDFQIIFVGKNAYKVSEIIDPVSSGVSSVEVCLLSMESGDWLISNLCNFLG